MGPELPGCPKIIRSRWIVPEKAIDNPAGTEISAVDADSDILLWVHILGYAIAFHIIGDWVISSFDEAETAIRILSVCIVNPLICFMFVQFNQKVLHSFHFSL